MQYSDAISKAGVCGGALAIWRRVRYSAGKLAYAGSSDTDWVGVMREPAYNSGDVKGYLTITKQGTIPCIASGAITQYAACYADTNGMVAGSGTVLVGVSLSTATANGDEIEVLPSPAAYIGSVARASLATDALDEYALELVGWNKNDLSAQATSAGAGYFGFVAGTLGSAGSYLVAEAASGNVKTDDTRRLWRLPVEYVSGGGFKIRVRAKQTTTLLTVGTTIVPTVYLVGDETVGSNLVTTIAATLTTAYANYDFVVTPTGLVPGNVLDINIHCVSTDTGGTVGTAAHISKISALIDVKG